MHSKDLRGSVRSGDIHLLQIIGVLAAMRYFTFSKAEKRASVNSG